MHLLKKIIFLKGYQVKFIETSSFTESKNFSEKTNALTKNKHFRGKKQHLY